MTLSDRFTLGTAFALVAAFAFYVSCMAGHFAHQTVLAAAISYGAWLVLSLTSFFWLQPKQNSAGIISMFASVAVFCILMVCFGDHFSQKAQYLSGSMFGGWFVLAVTFILWRNRVDQRQFAHPDPQR